MAKKHSLIGFVKTKYKSIKFNKKQDIGVNEFIKFYYGPRADKPIIGKVQKIYPKGVEVYTDYGWFFPSWDVIDRVFKPKITGRIKESKINAVNGTSPLPLIDAAINRIIETLKQKKIDVKIKDKRINKASEYSRTVDFTHKGKKISIVIDNKNSQTARVVGAPRKTEIKLNKSHKISTSIINKIVKYIEELSKSKKRGVASL